MNGAGLVWLLLPRLIGHIMCAVSLVLCHRRILILPLRSGTAHHERP